MLPAAHRLVDASSFREVTRRGSRASSRTVVTHLLLDEPHDVDTAGAIRPARVGFVVSKAVGGSVVRNRVQRRLRHLARPLLADLPAGSRLVVRALPASVGAASPELGRDLGSCLTRALARA